MRHQSAQIEEIRTPQHRRLRRSWFTRAAASVAVASSLLLGALPAQAVPMNGSKPVSGMNQTFRADNGINLKYHYYADGVDFRRPSGAVFFFDGDGTTRFNHPNSQFAQRMAKEAAAANKVFVFMEAPNKARSWYAGDFNRTASAVRQFAVNEVQPTAKGPVLLTGYSGGAEFLVAGVLDEGPTKLPAGSGAVLIGGGGTYGQRIAPATKTTKDLELSWVVGDSDGVGATLPRSWSAKDATARAVKDFRNAGYTGSYRGLVKGDHHSYDVPSFVRMGLYDLKN